jgi:acyl carrier protein
MRDQTIARLVKAISGVIQRDLAAEGRSVSELDFDELGLDSIAVLSVLVAVEDEFNIEFGDDTPPEALRSIGRLADYLEHAFFVAA